MAEHALQVGGDRPVREQRPAEVTAPDAPTVKVKVAKSTAGAALPGFTFTQEGSF